MRRRAFPKTRVWPEALTAEAWAPIIPRIAAKYGCPNDDEAVSLTWAAWQRAVETFDPTRGAFSKWFVWYARSKLGGMRRSRIRRARVERPSEWLENYGSVPEGPRPTLPAGALECLTPRQREAVELVYWRDLSHTAAAVHMGCTRQCVDQTIRYALTRLRESVTVEE